MKRIILFLMIISLLVSGRSSLYPYKVQFIDESTNTPIAKADIEVREIIYCKSGGICPVVILFFP